VVKTSYHNLLSNLTANHAKYSKTHPSHKFLKNPLETPHFSAIFRVWRPWAACRAEAASEGGNRAVKKMFKKSKKKVDPGLRVCEINTAHG
jgi:hypothetical protein